MNGAWPTVERLVNTDNVSASLATNLQVGARRTGANSLPLFNLTDLTEFTGDATVIKTKYGGFDEFEFDALTDGSSKPKVFNINFATKPNHPLLGRYLSFSYMTKGSSTSSGVWLTASLNGAVALSVTRSFTDYGVGARAETIYIPKNAQDITITLRSLSGSANAKMIGFKICDTALL